MFVAPPARSATRLLPALLIAFYGCSDPSAPIAPRVAPRAPSLDVVVAKVTNTDDSGAGSLRQAVFDAAATPGTVIQFDASLAGKTIVLTSGEIDVGTRLTIEGPVAGGIAVSGGLNSRLFQLGADGDLTVRNISIVNGRASSGGAVDLRDGTKMTVDHVLVANNEATAVGGAFEVANGATLTIVNSTISGNVSQSNGGAISGAGDITIRNSTIAFNRAGDPNGGGAFNLGSAAQLSLRNSIISNNTSPTIFTSCFWAATTTLIFSGRNLTDDANCGSDPSMQMGSAGLDALANNGGPTMTHAIRITSDALDRGTECSETTDQRYVPRNQGTSCDVGAFEFNDYGTFKFTIGPNISVNPKTGVATVTGTIACTKPGFANVDVTLNQAQKSLGRFTTIVQGSGFFAAASCGTSPSSWSATISPTSGKFENGTATASVSTAIYPTGFLKGDASATVKVFLVK